MTRKHLSNRLIFRLDFIPWDSPSLTWLGQRSPDNWNCIMVTSHERYQVQATRQVVQWQRKIRYPHWWPFVKELHRAVADSPKKAKMQRHYHVMVLPWGTFVVQLGKWRLQFKSSPLDKMAAILQTICSNEFSWINIFEFQIKCHWNMFFEISQYGSIGSDNGLSPSRRQAIILINADPVHRRIYCSTRERWVNELLNHTCVKPCAAWDYCRDILVDNWAPLISQGDNQK